MWDRLEQRELRRRARGAEVLKPGERPDPSLPEGTDRLPLIRHIVVLMMENHSYDNYLGMLAGRGEGFPLDPDGRPTAENIGVDGTVVRCHRLGSTSQFPQVPSQSWHATHRQWNDGKMDGFAASAQEVDPAVGPAIGMGYWTGEDLPFYYGLARTFPLADHWFSSCLGPTFPNRRFLISGTANGLIDDAPSHLLDYPPAGTIFDSLTRNGISWINYHPVARDKPRLRHAAHHRRRMIRRRLAALTSMLRRGRQDMQKDIQFTADLYPFGIARYMQHARGLDAFFADAEAGTLPSFSIVDPSFRDFSEENPQDIQKGESFAAEVINRVMHGQGWQHTLLIWIYDEHGGYYDHVPPPEAVPPDDVEGRSVNAHPAWLRVIRRILLAEQSPDAANGASDPLSYDRYGPRVPAVLVSPYARPECVLTDVFDHTSVLKLVEEKWNLPALTRRDAAAISPIGALDLTTPPAFLTPPSLPAPALAWGTW